MRQGLFTALAVTLLHPAVHNPLAEVHFEPIPLLACALFMRADPNKDACWRAFRIIQNVGRMLCSTERVADPQNSLSVWTDIEVAALVVLHETATQAVERAVLASEELARALPQFAEQMCEELQAAIASAEPDTRVMLLSMLAPWLLAVDVLSLGHIDYALGLLLVLDEEGDRDLKCIEDLWSLILRHRSMSAETILDHFLSRGSQGFPLDGLRTASKLIC